MSLFIYNKNRNFQGKTINLSLLLLYFLFKWCQIPPGHLQIKFAALHIDIVKTGGVTTMGSDRENPGAPNPNGPIGGPQA
jgi:hypothetical protein